MGQVSTGQLGTDNPCSGTHFHCAGARTDSKRNSLNILTVVDVSGHHNCDIVLQMKQELI